MKFVSFLSDQKSKTGYCHVGQSLAHDPVGKYIKTFLGKYIGVGSQRTKTDPITDVNKICH